MMTPRTVRELLRRVEAAQSLLDSSLAGAPVNRATMVTTLSGQRVIELNDARENLEHVRLTLVGAIASHEQLAGRKLEDVR